MRNAAAAIDFYTAAFGAKEEYRLVEPSGRVGQTELDFGGTTLMLSEEYPDMGTRDPDSVGGTTFAIHLHAAPLTTR